MPLTGGIELPVVRGIFTDEATGVVTDVPGILTGVVTDVPGILTGLVDGAVPVPTGVEKFPFGILYVMLSDGDDTGRDELEIDAEGLEVDVEDDLGGVTGGPQSNSTLWIPTSHPSCSECVGSWKVTEVAPPH